ncbi:MAG: putative LPS assembly protein LptD [Cytophagaceae bacterium]
MSFSAFAQTDTTLQDRTNNTPANTNDTIPAAIVQPQKQSDFETTVKYNARDSIRLDVVKQIAFLYGDAFIEYGNISLKAERIEIDWHNHTLTARGVKDTVTGRTIGIPVFKEGTDTYTADTIVYNFQTRRGLISGIITQQGEGYIHGNRVKKTDEALYINHADYTTCNLAHPHFYIRANKLKVIPEDKIVAGPFNLYVADIPTPLGFLLGVFPVPKKQKSGIIFPMYGESADRGFFLRNGGYFLRWSDYAATSLTGEIYSRGGHGAQAHTDYRSRYRFTGNFDLRYNYIKSGMEGFNTESKDYWLTWNHATISQRNSRLSAGVNFGSSNYNRFNAYNPSNYQSNVFSSTINYSRNFGNSPFNIAIGLRSDQNTRTQQYNFTVPSVAFNMNRVYPFKRKIGTGNRWYEKINTAYTLNTQILASNMSTRRSVPADTLQLSLDNFQRFFERPYAQYGAKHTIPINTTIKAFKYFNFNPFINYNGYTYFERLEYTINDNNEPIGTPVEGTTYTHDFNAGTSLTTRIFGTFGNPGGPVQVRHVMIPTINYTYRPDFYNINRSDFQEVQIEGRQRQILSRYQGFMYGAPAAGTQNLISFNVVNTFEAKAKTPKDTANPVKKFKLIENIGLTGGYDFTAEQFKWTLISLQARTRLFNKVDINFNTAYDPYVYIRNEENRVERIPEVRFSTDDQFQKPKNYNLALATNLNPSAKKPRFRERPVYDATQLAYINANPEMYVDFNIPWSLYVSYNMNFNRQPFGNATVIQSLNFNGDVKLSDKWKIGFNSGYDFVNQGITFTQINIYRDLHCWEMRANVIPFGPRRSYTFDINVKASILQDLRLNRRRDWYDNAMRTQPRGN